MKLTAHQNDVYNDIIDWYNGTDKFACLAGSAGTGKTTLIGRFVKNNRKRIKIAVTATTHKAVSVLRSKVSGVELHTIQKILGLQPNFDVSVFDINNVEFKILGKPVLDEYNLVIIDESSMLNSNLVKFIKDLANASEVKILFLGDLYQLPPVTEELSEVFYSENIKQFELTKIIRQKSDNNIGLFLSGIRIDVCHTLIDRLTELVKVKPELISMLDKEKEKLKGFITQYTKQLSDFNKTLAISPGGITREILNTYEQDKEFWQRNPNQGLKVEKNLDDFKTDLITSHVNKVNVNDLKFLAFTNVTVSNFNHLIRNSVKKEKALIAVDDLLIAKTTAVSKDTGCTIYNSQEYIVLSVELINSSFFNYYHLRLQNVNDVKEIINVDVIDPTDLNRYLKHIYAHKQYSIETRNWKEYYSILQSNQIFGTFDKNATTDIIYEEKTIEVKISSLINSTIDYSYAVTVHKSQGSTYKDVFVDLKDIIANSYCNNKVSKKLQILQLLYVAASRCENKCTIYM